MLQVYGCVFKHSNTIGDFSWMILQPEFQNYLFIFNDNTESFPNNYPTLDKINCEKGGGNAAIRPYQCVKPPKSKGIPTGSLTNGGFTSLTPNVKNIIDIALSQIKDILSNYKYDGIIYSATSMQNDLLGTGIFNVGLDVRTYITDKLKSFGEYKGILTDISEISTLRNVNTKSSDTKNNIYIPILFILFLLFLLILFYNSST